MPRQLSSYVAGVVRGDLGRSIFRDASVVDMLARRLPATLELAVAALIVALVLGALLGTAAALRPGSYLDTATMLLAQLGVSMPVFWLGILLMAFFSVRLGWLPAIGRGEPIAFALANPLALVDSVTHLVLPAFTLGWSNAAVISRLVRSSLLDALGEEYVRTARARGLAERRVVAGHALRNAALPVVSVLGVRFGVLLGGAVLTESVFGWPGSDISQ